MENEMEGKGRDAEAETIDIGSPLPCPNTVTIRRNPYRRARATPIKASQCYNSSISKLREVPPFPNEDILSAQNPENAPLQLSSTSHGKSESENIKVFLRIRPLLNSKGPGKVGSTVADQNQRLRAKNAWPQNPTKKNTLGREKIVKGSRICIMLNDPHSVTLSPPTDLQESKKIKSETYGGFSHVFSTDSSQLAVYERMVKPMVDDFLSGKNGMLAALGPSGSGKTHTVFGRPREPGMVPLALQHIFKETETRANQALRSFYISIFEIYSERGKAEKLFDLLRDGCELSMQQSTVKGLQEVLISSARQAESLIAQAMLKRATAMTNTNSQSSRSQCIINVCQKCEEAVSSPSNSAVLTIIDLAGAEREKKTGNQGTRFLESNFINNTLMVFGLCLRSLLEHQKNPKKPLQKHFQNSLLTRFLRDYLEGKKRMTLLLTAKSGEEDYLDTSYLLRQASPFMKIKYNEVEPSNIVPSKRQYQASSIVEKAKPSSILGQAKRMRLVSSEDSNEERNVKGLHISKGGVCKLKANRRTPKSQRDSQAQSERSHVIMQNFAKALWNILKQYNSKLKVAEMEIQNLRESIGHEKEKYQELETEINEFKAFCTCRQGSKGCNAYNQETFDAQASSMPRLHHSDYEPPLGTSCMLLDAEKSDRKDEDCSSRPRYRNASEVEGESKILTEFNDSLSLPNDEKLGPSSPMDASSTKACDHAGYRPDDTNASHQSDDKLILLNRQETFDAETLCEPRLDHSDDESVLGTSGTTLDTEKSNRKCWADSSKPGKRDALVVESKIVTEFNNSPLPTDETLEPSSPKAVSSTKGCDQVGSRHSERRDNYSCNPQKPKRRLLPSTSVLLRDLSNLDLVGEATTLKGRKDTRKSASGDVKRTDGSISLIRMLKSNLHF
ncbi:kinesin-like protein KIN-6 isoform X2 [Prosopis cineraria]|uniref:kinesin-like protein KIN-6 isoform X2 n=1 Tax=Prosopis cineraria TaxID=364024 RepID=UPI002410701E|nr:kinesin-like protein KIN-6 isoform X2 [Prosopis cineraria]